MIVDSLVHGDATHNGGEIHDFPFAGIVDCEPEPTETPTESPTGTEAPTETPTGTETPTETPTTPPTPTCTVGPEPTKSWPMEPAKPTRSREPGKGHDRPWHHRRPCNSLPPTGASVSPGAFYPALGLVAGGVVIFGAAQYKRRARRH